MPFPAMREFIIQVSTNANVQMRGASYWKKHWNHQPVAEKITMDPCRIDDYSQDDATKCVKRFRLLPGRVSCDSGGSHRTFVECAENLMSLRLN
ncbi:hypothetical protein AVEN_9511-1 [Araneus ventricosus]|uniref:Uncharacterized protein n=1 Tax=Araneus ventricosus TaxID=182803 RepID=A0A4Y2Q3R0_ARAVE|nr:hypothetical protein AVEN_9511-1 [Araneus ventricosus]